MTITTATTNRRTTRRTLVAVAGTVGALTLAAGLGACGSTNDDATSAATGRRAATTTSVPTTEAPVVVTGAGSGTSSNGGGSGSGSSGTGHSTTPSGPAPTIDSFTTPEDIDCHNGNFQTFSASWTTTGATEVTISIDGPGVYATYPADGDTSLPFNCSSPHTFLLTARGQDGRTATRSITLQPRNVQAQGSDDEDALVRTTAKVSAGSTGQGPAGDAECEGYASQINALDDLAVTAGDEAASDSAIVASNAVEDMAQDRGCFIVYA
jgi:hypothetical protein